MNKANEVTMTSPLIVVKCYQAYIRRIYKDIEELIRGGKMRDQDNYYILTDYQLPFASLELETQADLLEEVQDCKNLIILEQDQVKKFYNEKKEITAKVLEEKRKKDLKEDIKEEDVVQKKQKGILELGVYLINKEYFKKASKINNKNKFIEFIKENRMINFENTFLASTDGTDVFREEEAYLTYLDENV